MDPEKTESASKLERGATDARGPLGAGRFSRLLTRRQAGRLGVVQQDVAALGRRDGSSATDARGPFEQAYLSRLLARQQVHRVWVAR